MSMEWDAKMFATAAHGAVGQTRKYTGEPYIVHPAEVVGILKTLGWYSPSMIAAAWMHDVLEDTKVTEAIMSQFFPQDVVDLVLWLTDVAKPSDGNRAVRMGINKNYIAKAPGDAQTIKVADIISNVRSIIVLDPKFAQVYIPEKREVLDVLTKADKKLLDIANKLVDDFMNKAV